ncbi:MAG: DUF1801 domain-containing protein [Pirellulales bacterium]
MAKKVSKASKPVKKTAKKTAQKATKPKMDRPPLKPNADGVVLLSGGNPQIAKGYGDAPVQAYIAAVPGWKRELCRRIDALIVKTVPNVAKAVKWNTPFYGFEDQGWFMGYHCFDKYLKVSFFQGTSLKPLPPGESKQKNVRYFDIREDHVLDEKQFCDWIKQASKLPLEKM